jgi:hypothetical protein
VDHRRQFVGLVDALGQARASGVAEVGDGQAQHVAEGGHDEPRLHVAGRARALVVGAEVEEVAERADDEHQRHRLHQRAEGLFGRARGHAVGAVRLLGRRRSGGLRDEQARHIVDRRPVDQRLD